VTDKLTTGEVLDFPNPTPPKGMTRAQLRAAAGKRDGSLTALLETHKETARSFEPAPEQLLAWYQAQLAAVEVHVAALAASCLNLLFQPRKKSRDDEGWPEYYAMDARNRWGSDLLSELVKRQHCLSCPTHGIFGAGAGLTENQATALSLRGYIEGDGENRLGWQHRCEVCSADEIKAVAEGLMREHRAVTK